MIPILIKIFGCVWFSFFLTRLSVLLDFSSDLLLFSVSVITSEPKELKNDNVNEDYQN